MYIPSSAYPGKEKKTMLVCEEINEAMRLDKYKLIQEIPYFLPNKIEPF